MTEKKAKKNSLLQGASIFFFLVLYINLRHGVQNNVDWIVIIFATVFFIFALLKYLKTRRATVAE